MLLEQIFLEEKIQQQEGMPRPRLESGPRGTHPYHAYIKCIYGLDFLILACFEKEFNPIGPGKIYEKMFLNYASLLSYLSRL